MNRREWKFDKPASELAVAAAKRGEYHMGRLSVWEEERESIGAAISEAGVQVRGYAVTGGERHEVVIDPTLAKRLSECETKMELHRVKAGEYAQWYSALKDSERSFSLDHDDWLFFFGLHGDEDE